MSGQHQANAKCRNSVAAIYNNYTTKTCRIVYIRVHFFRMDCICFVYRICVQFRSAWARPRLAITNFFQPPQKTLKFQPSIFLHCENMARTGLFRALLLVFYPFSRQFSQRLILPRPETLGAQGFRKTHGICFHLFVIIHGSYAGVSRI